MFRTNTLYDVAQSDPHNDYSLTTNVGEPYHLQSIRHLPDHADAHALVPAAFPQRKVSQAPSSLTLSLEPPSRFSTSFEGLISPPPSAGLKRSPHIRRKERPKRLSQIKLVSSVDVNAYESQQLLQLPTPPPSGTQYTHSFLSPAVPYNRHLSAPIQAHPRQESSERTGFALPDSHAHSPTSPAVPYNHHLSAPIRAHPRQENTEHTDFALPESHARSPPSPVAARRPPLSAPIRSHARQESLKRTGFAAPDSHTHSPTSPSVPRNKLLPAPIRTQVPREDLEHADYAIPDSPRSIYSTMTAQDTGIFHVEWDTTGYIKPEGTNYPRPFDPDTWLVPEEEGPGLTRQKTEVIVELLRERRRRAGLE